MKKQICFVGFDEGEEAALHPSLSGLNGVWECSFWREEKAGLEAMDRTPFDVVILNLGIRGIAESTFLHQAASRHPNASRFVVGRDSDRDLLGCMDTSHQFIARPWKAAEMVASIERQLALDGWLSNDKLRTFIPRLRELPGLPPIYFDVLRKSENPESTPESVASVIAQDETLTEQLLEMINSPASGFAQKIGSPQEAVSKLGLATVKTLVLCSQFYRESLRVKNASLPIDQLWRHSFGVAKTAAKIVFHCIGSDLMAGSAYTAGLLHNAGQIVLATQLAKEYSTVLNLSRKQKRPLPEVETELLGVTSNEVGAYLLGLWGLPLPVVEATALCLTPAKAVPVEFSLLTVVHVANALTAEDQKPGGGLPLPVLDAAYLATLDLPRDAAAWRALLAKKLVSGENTEFRTRIIERPPPPKPSKPKKAKAEKKEEQKSKRALPVKKMVALAAVVVAVIAVIKLKPSFTRAPRATAAVVASDPQAPAPTESTPPVNTSPLDTVKLQSIIYSTGHPVALINGAALEVGGHLNGLTVISISRTEVVLSCKGEKRSFKLQ
jgi:HD-like signal output (HDOD) protein